MAARPPADLRTESFNARVRSANLWPGSAALFTQLTDAEIVSMSTVLPEETVRDMRWAGLVAPADLAELLRELRACLEPTQAVEVEDEVTPRVRRAADQTPVADSACVKHALRIATLANRVANLFGQEDLHSLDYLFALRSALDLEVLLESFAERATTSALHADELSVAVSPCLLWRTLVIAQEQADDICEGLSSSASTGQRPSLGTLTDAINSLSMHITLHWESAMTPFPNGETFQSPEQFAEDVRAFTGRRSLTTMQNLRAIEEERLRSLQKPDHVQGQQGPNAPARTPVFSGDGSGAGATSEWGQLTTQHAITLRSAMVQGSFKRWNTPAELNILHLLRYSPVARVEPDGMVRPPLAVGKFTDLYSLIWDTASDMLEKLCPVEGGFRIPLGTMAKLTAGLLAFDRHGFSHRLLAFPTAIRRGEARDAESRVTPPVFFTNRNMTWLGLDSSFYMLRKIVNMGILPRILLDEKGVLSLRDAAQHLRIRFGDAMSAGDVSRMVEATITRHVNAITDAASDLVRAQSGEIPPPASNMDSQLDSPEQPPLKPLVTMDPSGAWRWPKLEDRVRDWPESFSQFYRDAETEFQSELRRTIAQQAAPSGSTIPQQQSWVGIPKAAGVPGRQEKGAAPAGGTRKRPAEDPPVQSTRSKRERRSARGAGRNASATTGVNTLTCYACLGPHAAGAPGCLVPKGSGKPFVDLPPDLPFELAGRIAIWRSQVQGTWTRMSTARGAAPGQDSARPAAGRGTRNA